MLYLPYIWLLFVVGGLLLAVIVQVKTRLSVDNRTVFWIDDWIARSQLEANERNRALIELRQPAKGGLQFAGLFETLLRKTADELSQQSNPLARKVGRPLKLCIGLPAGERWRYLADSGAHEDVEQAMKHLITAIDKRNSLELVSTLGRIVYHLLYGSLEISEVEAQHNLERLKEDLYKCAIASQGEEAGRVRNLLQRWRSDWEEGEIRATLPLNDMIVGIVTCFAADPYDITFEWIDPSAQESINHNIADIIKRGVSLLGSSDFDMKLLFIYEALEPPLYLRRTG